MLHYIGAPSVEVYNTFTFEAGKELDLKTVTTKFDGYFMPRKNLTLERNKFFSRVQKPTETADQYVTELKNLASNCEFGDLQSSLIKDRIVSGARSEAVRGRLLRESNLTLEKALEICRSHELVEQTKSIVAVNQMSDVKPRQYQKKPFRQGQRPSRPSHQGHQQGQGHQQSRPQGQGHQQSRTQGQGQQSGPKRSSCWNCGYSHKRGPDSCPAMGKKCAVCRKMNHFARVCKSRKTDERVNLLEEELEYSEIADDMRDLSCGIIDVDLKSMDNMNKSEDDEHWIETIRLNNVDCKVQIDTGAKCNVISQNQLQRIMQKPQFKRSDVRIKAFGGEIHKPSGRVDIKCSYGHNVDTFAFEVVDFNTITILGAKASKLLHLVERLYTMELTTIIEKYKDVFDGIGCLPDIYKLHIDESVEPVANAVRFIPAPIRNDVEEELKRMENL